MRRALQWMTAFVVVAGVAFAIYATAWTPFRQELRKRVIAGQLQGIYLRSGGSVPEYRDVVRLRETAAWLRSALRYSPTDPLLRVQLAGAYQLLGLEQQAFEEWQKAVRYNPRPEIYLAMAEAQLAEGRSDDAVTSYAHVAAFYPPDLDVMPPALRDPIKRRVQELYGPDVAAMLR